MCFQVEEVQAEDEDEDNFNNDDGSEISDDEDRTGMDDEMRGRANVSGIESTQKEEQQSGQGYAEEEITSPAWYVIPYFCEPINDNARLAERREVM